jgi:hypothetical protein
MSNRLRTLVVIFATGATLLFALGFGIAGVAAAHESTCHADHTCPADTTPPRYQCGDNPLSQCAQPNGPDASQANAAPPLGGPPSRADCESYEIFYKGTICEQALQTSSPSALPSVGASTPSIVVPSPSGLSTADPFATVAPLGTGGALFGATFLVFFLSISVFFMLCTWRLFSKAGEPGWAALIPIYGTIVYLKIAGKPWWWIFILWLVIPALIANIDLSKNFGRSTGFGVGLSFLPFIFLPILAFGPAQYRGNDLGPRPLPL